MAPIDTFVIIEIMKPLPKPCHTIRLQGRFGMGVFDREGAQRTQKDYFIEDHSALYIIRGRDFYEDHSVQLPFGPGSVIQRFPGRRHTLSFEAGHPMTQLAIRISLASFTYLETHHGQRVLQPVFHVGP